MNKRARVAGIARTSLLVLAWSVAVPAVARASAGPGPARQPPPGLATAPASERAGSGSADASGAERPEGNGAPLEPYLFLSILAGGGILAAGGSVLNGRRAR